MTTLDGSLSAMPFLYSASEIDSLLGMPMYSCQINTLSTVFALSLYSSLYDILSMYWHPIYVVSWNFQGDVLHIVDSLVFMSYLHIFPMLMLCHLPSFPPHRRGSRCSPSGAGQLRRTSTGHKRSGASLPSTGEAGPDWR